MNADRGPVLDPLGILLVGEPTVCTIVSGHVGRGHAYLTTVSTFAAGLEHLAREVTDLVVLDVVALDVTAAEGVDVLRQLHPDVTVLPLEGDGPRPDPAWCEQVGELVDQLRRDRPGVRRRRTEAALLERVKEQSAVAAVARLVQSHPPRSALLGGVAHALVPAFQRPDLAGARIEIDGEQAEAGSTDLTVEIRVPIMVDGARRGHVRVGYTDEQDFLDEERSLLRTVAGSVAAWIAAEDADRARRESELRLQGMFDHALETILLFDDERRVVDANPAALRLLGLPRHDVVGNPLRSLVEVVDGPTGDLVALVRDQGRLELEQVVRCRDGRELVLVLNAVADIVPDLHLLTARDVTAQRQAERSVRRSEQRFRALVEAASDVVAVVDADLTIRFAGPSVERLMGHRVAEVVGRKVTDLLARSDLEAIDDHWAAVLGTTDPVGPMVHRLLHRDGSWRYVEVVHTNRIDDPAVGGVVINMRDVTERIHAQRALAESEGRFRRLAENARDVIYRFALHPEPHFEYVSPAVEDLLGYPPEYFYADWRRGREVLVRPEETILRADLRSDELLDDVVEMRHRDGSIRWFERRAVVLRDRDGQALAIEAIERDVTATRRAEEALRASEARLARVLETMTEGLLMFDHAGNLTYANPAAEDIFEAGREELVGRKYTDPAWNLLDADGEPIAAEDRIVAQVLESRQPVRGFILSRRRRDGSWVAWETNGSPLRDPAGEFVGILLTLRAVTERLRADQTLRGALEREREATEHLRRLDEMKTGFLQAVSHELRTPLTALLGFSVLLQRHAELPSERVDELTARLTANAEKLDRLLADLLDVDRLSRGTLEPRRSQVDVDGLLHRVLDELDVPAERVTIHDGRLRARIDGPRTERIVENLVLNALRHTEGTVEVSSHVTVDGLELTVADRGAGVPDELKDLLFEPFQQGDTPAARVGGAGIGLSVVRSFAELHGGRAWVEDRPGGGSLFRVALPTSEPPLPVDAT